MRSYTNHVPPPKHWPTLILSLTGLCGILALHCSGAQNALFLHGYTGGNFLNANSPASTHFQAVSSEDVDRTNFVEIGTWSRLPAATAYDVTGAESIDSIALFNGPDALRT